MDSIETIQLYPNTWIPKCLNTWMNTRKPENLNSEYLNTWMNTRIPGRYFCNWHMFQCIESQTQTQCCEPVMGMRVDYIVSFCLFGFGMWTFVRRCWMFACQATCKHLSRTHHNMQSIVCFGCICILPSLHVSALSNTYCASRNQYG